MPSFKFKARNAYGEQETGRVSAPSRLAVAGRLQERGVIVTDIEQIDDRPNLLFTLLNRWLSRPRPIDLEIGLQQLALMLRSGTTLLSAIRSLELSATSLASRLMWGAVSESLQSGESLSVSMENQGCFSDFTIQMVKVGEQTGHLAPVLSRASLTMQRSRTVRDESVSTLVYPVLVVVMAFAVTVYMVAYLIPRLEIYLRSLGKEIPALTQVLMDGSFWLRQNAVLVLIGLAGMILIPVLIAATMEGRLFIDKWLLRLPIVGRSLRLADTSTFSSSLGLLVGSGVALIDSLRIVENLIRNRFSRTIVKVARDKIIQGSNMAEAFDQPYAFTPMLKQMVAVGEQTGNLESVMAETAEFHEKQFLSLMRRLNALLTPMLTILIGVIVGYVYIAFFVALFAAAN